MSKYEHDLALSILQDIGDQIPEEDVNILSRLCAVETVGSEDPEAVNLGVGLVQKYGKKLRPDWKDIEEVRSSPVGTVKHCAGAFGRKYRVERLTDRVVWKLDKEGGE